MTQESVVEKYFVEKISAVGGFTVKLQVPGQNHLPDRLAILPGGRVLFVELKRPVGGRLSAGQKERLKRLTLLGVEVHTLKNKEEINAVILGSAPLPATND